MFPDRHYVPKPLTGTARRKSRQWRTKAVKGKVSVVRRNVMRKKMGTDPRMSRGAIAALDLPFLVQPIDFLGLIDDVFAKQLNVGFAHMTVARAGG